MSATQDNLFIKLVYCPLGPTLTNILLTALEDEIVRPLINAGTIKFYARYVDDTLILTKPENIPSILDSFNSFHPHIQFTSEEFVDSNDVHFLDIKIDPQGTTIYRKSTHTGHSTHTIPASHLGLGK